MIPSLILFGFVFGRWWKLSLAASAMAWPLLLVVTRVIGLEWGLMGAAVLAVGNTLAGVLVLQGVLWIARRRPGRSAFMRNSSIT